jgi:OPA family sugar phosphate sensor protein UhpC-like MFS transporter
MVGFMHLLKYFSPPLHEPEIEDPQEVKKQYKYWRLRIFSSIYIGYVFYYFTRRTYTCVMPFLIEDLGYDKSHLGLLSSIFAITYGVSKFLSGGMADRCNPRYFMSIGLILTGVINIFFGLSSSLTVLAVFWGLNGWFQGWGAPPCARLLTYWFSQQERGSWWGVWNTSHSLGGFLIPFVVVYGASFLGWRLAVFIPSFICIAGGFLLMNRLRDTPRSLGLPTIEKFKNELNLPRQENEEVKISVKEMLFTYVLSNRLIWLLGVAYFFVYFVRMALGDWGVLFLAQAKGYTVMAASVAIACFEAGGIVGSLVAGWVSDKIYLGRRAPVCALFCAGVICAVVALWVLPGGLSFIHWSLFFISGFLIFGPQMLIGIAAVELSDKRAAGTATGFVGWIAYLGAAVSGYPLGVVIDRWNWGGFIFVVTLAGIVSLALLLPLWKVKMNPHAEDSIEVTPQR